MKIRKYQAKQLDPNTVVVPLADHNLAVDHIKKEAIRAVDALHKIGRITSGMRDFIVARIKES